MWLLIRQEELARNTKGPRLAISDSEVAEGIGVTKRRAGDYRKELAALGLVEVQESKTGKRKGILIDKVKY